jgi:hypothetical protein
MNSHHFFNKFCDNRGLFTKAGVFGAALAVAAPALALNIVPTFDKSITSLANASTVEADINQALSVYDAALSSNVTVGISFGWGEIDGAAVSSSDASESESNIYSGYSYAQVVSDFNKAAAANPNDAILVSAAANMAAANPTTVTNFAFTKAEAQALGLVPATGMGTDGYVGFSTKIAYSFDPTTTPAGEYDFEALVEHEVAEVLGRISGISSTKPTLATPFDTMRFSAAGTHAYGYTSPAYFSYDGGKTNLVTFNSTGGGDRGDWANAASNDAFDAVASKGANMTLSTADLQVLDALGWDGANNPGGFASSGVAGVGQPGAMGDIGGVPEPTTWAMMIVGVGFAGAVMRRQRAALRSVAA